MIIRRHSIQSHDNLGANVFKLMIISVCCIQTQLIVFMPNAELWSGECAVSPERCPFLSPVLPRGTTRPRRHFGQRAADGQSALEPLRVWRERGGEPSPAPCPAHVESGTTASQILHTQGWGTEKNG